VLDILSALITLSAFTLDWLSQKCFKALNMSKALKARNLFKTGIQSRMPVPQMSKPPTPLVSQKADQDLMRIILT
jgi:hypothetical protein